MNPLPWWLCALGVVAGCGVPPATSSPGGAASARAFTATISSAPVASAVAQPLAAVELPRGARLPATYPAGDGALWRAPPLRQLWLDRGGLHGLREDCTIVDVDPTTGAFARSTPAPAELLGRAGGGRCVCEPVPLEVGAVFGCDGHYGLVDVTTRAVRFTFDVAPRERWRFAADENALFVSADGPQPVTALGARDGAPRWTRDLSPSWLDLVSPAADVLLVPRTMKQGGISGIDRRAGTERWRLDGDSSFALTRDGSLFVRFESGNLVAHDAGSGRERWRYAITGYRRIAVGPHAFYIHVGDGTLVALGTADGRELWRAKVPALSVLDELFATRSRLVVWQSEAPMRVLDAATGAHLWSYDYESAEPMLLVDGDRELLLLERSAPGEPALLAFDPERNLSARDLTFSGAVRIEGVPSGSPSSFAGVRLHVGRQEYPVGADGRFHVKLWGRGSLPADVDFAAWSEHHRGPQLPTSASCPTTDRAVVDFEGATRAATHDFVISFGPCPVPF